jgi:branched-chain amino acid transport system ATP-binding protein
MSVLRCLELSCSFGGVRILDRVTLEIPARSCVAIIGPNSAGKTTLLNAVSGLVDLDSGQVLINGREVSSWSFPARARGGLIRSYEERGIWAKLSVLDNVAAAAAELPLAEARNLARVILAKIGLTYALSREGRVLSMGERRKVELARVLLRLQMMGPDSLIVLDEPFRGLDAEAQKDLAKLLREHLLGRSTVLMIEHNRRMARELSDRLLWLEKGRLTEEIPAEALSEGSVTDEANLTACANTLNRKAILSVEEMRAGYGSLEVLRGISLECFGGEAIQIDGPNGCGKSTLLKVIAGSLTPLSGRVVFSGVALPPGAEHVSRGLLYVPQGGRLIGQMTVRAQVEMTADVARRCKRTGSATRLFREAFPVLEQLKDQRADQLASGFRALVAMWVSLAAEPTLLLVDEPGAALAPELRERVYSFLHETWLTNEKAFLFVEHNARYPWARLLHLTGGLLSEDTVMSTPQGFVASQTGPGPAPE